MTVRTLLVAQLVVVIQLVMLYGAFRMIIGDNRTGLIIIGAAGAINALLLEKLFAALPSGRRFPPVAFRVLAGVCVLAVVTAIIMPPH